MISIQFARKRSTQAIEPQAPTITFLDLLKECPGLLAIIVFVWGVEAFLSKLLEAPKVLP